MSDAEEIDGEAQQIVEEPEPEIEEERTTVSYETIASGLSNIKKTAGKQISTNLNSFRWLNIRLYNSELREEECLGYN